MAWDFSTDPEYAAQLAWANEFVREECEPLDLIIKESHDLKDPVRQALIPPRQEDREEAGLVGEAPRTRPRRTGLRQVKLALMNESSVERNARRPSSAATHPIPGTARSSRTTARRSRKRDIWNRCWTTTSLVLLDDGTPRWCRPEGVQQLRRAG